MKIVVISYSFTGNNQSLAAGVAAELAAEHVKIREAKPRTNQRIVMDVLLNRIPKLNPITVNVKDYDLVIFTGPIWMGKIATPFRSCFKQFKDDLGCYAFVSISGGTLGPNPKLADELQERLGREPAALIDLHIADLLPSNPKPAMKDTSAYRLKNKDVKSLTGKIVKVIRRTMERDSRKLI